MLVLLDLSTAFDSVDHNILLNRLRDHIGLSGTVLMVISSYFSKSSKINCGVSQGFLLGTLLLIYIYADDTQLYVAVSPDDGGPNDSLFKSIFDFNDILISQNLSHLYQDETDILVIGSEAHKEKLVTNLNSLGLTPRQQARNLSLGL